MIGKRAILMLLSSLLVMSCTNGVPKKAKEAIRTYCQETYSHPETYTPGKYERLDNEVVYLPNSDLRGEAVVIQHSFSHLDRSGNPITSDVTFFLKPDMSVVYRGVMR